jgi:hypothetical protein
MFAFLSILHYPYQLLIPHVPNLQSDLQAVEGVPKDRLIAGSQPPHVNAPDIAQRPAHKDACKENYDQSQPNEHVEKGLGDLVHLQSVKV